MSATARILLVLSLVSWLGSVLFLSFVVAPTVFGSFPSEEAGRVMSALFPLYYKIGAGCGAALLVAALMLRRVSRRSTWSVVSGLAMVMLVATLYAAMIVQPRAAALRPQLHAADAPPAARVEFDQLHRRSVQLNSVVLLGGLIIAVTAALSIKP